MQDQQSELFGCPEAWSQHLNIPLASLVERLQGVPRIEARLPGHSSMQSAYMESDVRRVCADLIADADRVDKQ